MGVGGAVDATAAGGTDTGTFPAKRLLRALSAVINAIDPRLSGRCVGASRASKVVGSRIRL